MGESLQNFLFFFLGHCKESFIFNLPPENLYFHWLVQNLALISHWPTLIRANVLPRRIFHFSILPKWVGQWAASGPEIPPPLFPQGAKLAYGARWPVVIVRALASLRSIRDCDSTLCVYADRCVLDLTGSVNCVDPTVAGHSCASVFYYVTRLGHLHLTFSRSFQS